jgi:hypothetical protein
MKPLQRKYEALKKILREAYFEKEHAEVDEQWQVNAMRRIKGLGPITSRPNFLVFFERFVWRLTPATCLLIIVGAIIFLKLGFFPDYDVLTLFINDTEELSLAQLF